MQSNKAMLNKAARQLRAKTAADRKLAELAVDQQEGEEYAYTGIQPEDFKHSVETFTKEDFRRLIDTSLQKKGHDYPTKQKQYRGDIEAGEWYANATPIVLGHGGRLRNGLNRCKAWLDYLNSQAIVTWVRLNVARCEKLTDDVPYHDDYGRPRDAAFSFTKSPLLAQAALALLQQVYSQAPSVPRQLAMIEAMEPYTKPFVDARSCNKFGGAAIIVALALLVKMWPEEEEYLVKCYTGMQRKHLDGLPVRVRRFVDHAKRTGLATQRKGELMARAFSALAPALKGTPMAYTSATWPKFCAMVKEHFPLQAIATRR